jgi:hypothetical protein
MLSKKQPLPWEFDPYDPYFPITYEGVGIGFCKSGFAPQIVRALNEDRKLRQALQLACSDLIEQSGGDPNRVNELIEKYLEKTERPKHGTGAIACLLRDRQEELDMSDKDFTRFCDSYKLSAEALKDIYEGKVISDRHLGVLARILRKSVEELTVVRDGLPESELDIRRWKIKEDGGVSRKRNPTTKLFSLRHPQAREGKIADANSD